MSKHLLGTALLLAVLTRTAHAATVSTAAVTVQFNDRAECVIVNPGPRPVLVRSLELIGFFGDVFADGANVELGPRRTLRVFARGKQHGAGSDPMFCQADVAGPARSVRLTICTGPEFESCTAVLE